jgi:hypothetical protein
MPSRRTVLSAASLLGVSALSGCSDLFRPEPEYLHFVTVANRSDTPHDIQFNVYDDADESLYSYGNTFAPNTTQDGFLIEGTPVRVFASVDSSEQVERSWNMDVCGDDATGRSGLLLSVPEQAEPGTLSFQWDCQALTRPNE